MNEINFTEDIEKALAVLQGGGIILYPTDTIWGLGCDATNMEAVQKIYEIKQRPSNKAMVVLVAGEREILKYVSQADLAIFDFIENLEKPTTVIYEGAIGLADNLVAEDGSIAIRIVKDDFCKTLIKRFRKPLVSTSANISGEESPKSFSEITERIKAQVDYVVHHRQNDTTESASSSIIKWGRNGDVTYIRR